MATILAFERKGETPRKRAADGPAEILLFTGIRYERLADRRRPPPKGRRQAHQEPAEQAQG